MPHNGTPAGPSKPPFLEFVALIALMMGMTAFSIDNLLPAFGAIRTDFALDDPNGVQMLVYAYLIGIAVAQIVYGTISDVVGRRPALLVGLAIYAVGCLIALVTDDFALLIVARVVQGVGASAGRVMAVAIVRDRFEGREMARIMSLVMMVFLTVPIVAPALGSLILVFGSWHLIFVAMLALGVAAAIWFALRMPETLHPEYRVPFSMRAIGAGMVMTVTNRRAFGYATGMGLMMGALMAYVGSASQVFDTDIYKLGHLFPVVFAGVAAIMAAASFLNASLVRRLGMRRLSHGGVIGFVVVSLAMVAAAQFLFALTVPNFNSTAMEPLGAVAGTASSFIGFYTTLMAALIALFVGHAFDGTVLPISLGYAGLGILALLAVLWAEKGRLFHHA